MALNDDALTTVADVRTYLDVTSTSKPTDAWIEGVVNGISREIHLYTGRYYRPAEDEESVRIFACRGDTETVAIDDCREIDRVRVAATPAAEDSDTWDDIDAGDWWAEPLNDAVKTEIRLLRAGELPLTGTGWDALAFHARNLASDYLTGYAWRAIEVRGKYGHETIPANVDLAVRMWLQNIHKRDVAYFSARLSEGAVPLPGAIPADVKELLDQERETTGSPVLAI